MPIASTTNRLRSPSGLRGTPRFLFQRRAGKSNGGFDNGVGQMRNLAGHNFQPLAANDVAVGNPQCFAAFEAAQGRHHGALVIQGRHFGAQFVDQNLPLHRLSFGNAQQVVRFGVGNQQIAEILARREDLQQNRQRLAIALEQCGQRQRIAGSADKAIQIIQRHVGIAEPRQMLGKLIAHIGSQIERDAR